MRERSVGKPLCYYYWKPLNFSETCDFFHFALFLILLDVVDNFSQIFENSRILLSFGAQFKKLPSDLSLLRKAFNKTSVLLVCQEVGARKENSVIFWRQIPDAECFGVPGWH